MPGPCSSRGARSLVVLGLVCGLASLGRVGAGLAHPPYLGPPLGHAGPLTVVRHAPPAVPPYSTQINIFRWLSAFPPPVLHRALLLTQGPPLHHPLHHPVVHHAPPPAVLPAAPLLPPPPPPLVPAVVKTPLAAAPPPPPPLPLPLPAGFPLATNFNFPPEALPFPPSILPASGFLPLAGRGLLPLPTPLTPAFKTPLPLPLPSATPLTPFNPAVLNPAQFNPAQFNPSVFNPGALSPGALPHSFGLLPGFGPGLGLGPVPLLPPQDLDFGPSFRLPATPAPAAPAHPAQHAPAPAPSPAPASFTLHDSHPALYRQYLPAANGITRATAGNLAL